MLSDPKVEQKLLQSLSEFSGMIFRNAKLSEKYVDGRDVVVAELTFSSKLNPSQTKIAVFALDKHITLEAQEEIVEKIIEEK